MKPSGPGLWFVGSFCFLICRFYFTSGLPRWFSGKESACQCKRDKGCGYDPRLERCLGVGNGTPLQYFCLGNPINKGAWWAAVHEVTKSQARLGNYSFISSAKAYDCVDHNRMWKALKEMGIPDHRTCLLRSLCAGQEAS